MPKKRTKRAEPRTAMKDEPADLPVKGDAGSKVRGGVTKERTLGRTYDAIKNLGERFRVR